MDYDEWPVQDAKARFSEMLERCVHEGPQLITKRGREAAMLVSIDERKRLSSGSRLSVREALLSDYGRGEIPVPARGKLRQRKPDVIG